MTSLRELLLRGNQFNGSIPTCLGCNARNITRLDLSNNQLSGLLPSCLGQLTQLRYLLLHRNELSGELNESLCAWSDLEWLNVAQNNFSGALPPCIGKMRAVETFEVSGNQLTGRIPQDICELHRIRNLYLEGNQFTGEVPPCVSKLHFLTMFAASQNNLTGALPEDICTLGRLEVIDLADNQLTGSILPCVSKLENLTTLKLHRNKLSGGMPGFGGMPALEVVSVHSNSLSGNLSGIGQVTGLVTFAAHNNRFTGELPDLTELRSLQHITVHNNDFHGNLPKLPPSTTVALLHGNMMSGKLTHLGTVAAVDETLKLKLVLALAGNFIAGPLDDVSNRVRNSEPLLQNRSTSVFLASDVDGQRAGVLLLAVIGVVTLHSLRRSPDRQDAHGAGETSHHAQLSMALQRCHRMMKLQSGAALMCFGIYSSCEDSIAGGHSLLRWTAVYGRGWQMYIIYVIILVCNGAALLSLFSFAVDPGRSRNAFGGRGCSPGCSWRWWSWHATHPHCSTAT
eukprot:TRINITY_DN41879_c1_g1_i2.p1 TRINITY_DN41879_c1_g1~~TRINITY_DN41879_c1_g1_i2.p1  ORF type:complete len:587 (-),score=37.51 TRINITY_DN41879_c1_g1_i2:1323-2855(-)